MTELLRERGGKPPQPVIMLNDGVPVPAVEEPPKLVLLCRREVASLGWCANMTSSPSH